MRIFQAMRPRDQGGLASWVVLAMRSRHWARLRCGHPPSLDPDRGNLQFHCDVNWLDLVHHLTHHDVMQRTTISLPEPLIRQLKVVAATRGISMSEVIREALEEKAQEVRPKPRSLGMGASGHTDTARRAGEDRPEPRAWR